METLGSFPHTSRIQAACQPFTRKTRSGPVRNCIDCRAERRKIETVEISEQLLHPEQLSRKILAAVAASVVCTCSASYAEIQTVAPQDVTTLARSLPKQSVNKGKVWLILLAGATGLFGGALALERNSALFPAIAKANQAMAATRAKQKNKAETQAAIEVQRASDGDTESAVLQGLADARSKSLAEPSGSGPESSNGPPSDPTATIGLEEGTRAGGGAESARRPSEAGKLDEAREKIAAEQSSSGG